jgi:hypothetical protein
LVASVRKSTSGKISLDRPATDSITIPRHNPVNAITMGGIVKDAGLTIARFKELL